MIHHIVFNNNKNLHEYLTENFPNYSVDNSEVSLSTHVTRMKCGDVSLTIFDGKVLAIDLTETVL